MENECVAAKEILGAAAELAEAEGNPVDRIKRRGVTVVSCPRCGRYSFDTHGFTEQWLERLYSLDKNITVAIMGCAVNGPEEAKHANLGITGAGNKALIFRQGKAIRTIDVTEVGAAFAEELEKL
jgi:(E)-4-hydroxy-3-methylbut-2-enyl-diphosphate synthase